MYSNAEQNYIKAIYRLQEEAEMVATSTLASSLGVTAASVTGMLKKLSRAKMVIYRPHKGVRLTEKGRRSALYVLRRHRLIELFLTNILNLPWESVHSEAEKLEHSISDVVLERIDKLLGYPECDPHGSPIPLSDGTMPVSKTIRLTELESGRQAVVVEVDDKESELLRHLKKIGLIPGVRIFLEEIQIIDGMRIIKCGQRRQVVSPTVASAVWVDEDI